MFSFLSDSRGDLSSVVPTVSELLNLRDPVQVARDALASGWARPLGTITELVADHPSLGDQEAAS